MMAINLLSNVLFVVDKQTNPMYVYLYKPTITFELIGSWCDCEMK